MIKWINRLMYSIIVALGLMLVFSATDGYYLQQEVNKELASAIETGQFDSIQSGKYYAPTPLYEVDNENYSLYIYNIGFYTSVNGEVVGKDGLSMVIYQKQGSTFQNADEITISSEHIEKKYILVQFGNYPVFTLTEENLFQSAVDLRLFENEHETEEIRKISFKRDEQITHEINYVFENEAYHVGTSLTEFYEENHKQLDEELPNVYIHSQKLETNVMVWVWVAIYACVVIVGTVLYKYLKKYVKLGKKALTPGLEKDLEKLNDKTEV